MKLVVLTLAVVALVAPEADAKCGPGDVAAFPPPGAELPTNGRIVLVGSGVHAARVEAMKDAWLAAKEGSVALRIESVLRGGMGESQVVLAPLEHLRPRTTYTLSLGDAGGPFTWTTGEGPDLAPPLWSAPPAVAGVSRQSFGCGPEVFAHLRVRADGAYFRAEVTGPDGETSVAFVGRDRHGLVGVGHGMCGGPFRLESGARYTVRIAAVDGAGNETPARPLTFLVPESEVSFDAAAWLAGHRPAAEAAHPRLLARPTSVRWPTLPPALLVVLFPAALSLLVLGRVLLVAARHAPRGRTDHWVPVAAAAGAFARHVRRVRLRAVASAVGILYGPMVPAVAGLELAGAPGALVGGALGVAAAALMLARAPNLGNTELRVELAGRLSPPADAEWVGLLRAERYRSFARIETDDNVGFLSLGPESLLIRTEEGEVAVPRAMITGLRPIPVSVAPGLAWLRLDFVDGAQPRSLLLMSRDGARLPDLRARTAALADRLRGWLGAA